MYRSIVILLTNGFLQRFLAANIAYLRAQLDGADALLESRPRPIA
ncbi:MAG: hypothetical protein ABI619_14400 [Betaproteobacteria bacterium]